MVVPSLHLRNLYYNISEKFSQAESTYLYPIQLSVMGCLYRTKSYYNFQLFFLVVVVRGIYQIFGELFMTKTYFLVKSNASTRISRVNHMDVTVHQPPLPT